MVVFHHVLTGRAQPLQYGLRSRLCDLLHCGPGESEGEEGNPFDDISAAGRLDRCLDRCLGHRELHRLHAPTI